VVKDVQLKCTFGLVMSRLGVLQKFSAFEQRVLAII